MAIRARNLDLAVESMKRKSTAIVGDVTATLTLPVYATIADEKIEHIDIYTKSTISANSSETMVITARLATDSDATLQVRGASASGADTNTISANSRYRLTPSANNSLTAGTLIELNFSAVCALMSAVICVVTYTPLTKKKSR